MSEIAMTKAQAARWAIYCAKAVISNQLEARDAELGFISSIDPWLRWADRWLSFEDRTPQSLHTALITSHWCAGAAADAAKCAIAPRHKRVLDYALRNAKEAASMAAKYGIDVEALAKKAVEDEP